jgi:serine protease
MRGTFFLFVLLISYSGFSQKELPSFKLPEGITPDDYIANTVLLKLKPAKQTTTDAGSRKMNNIPLIVAYQPLISKELSRAAARSRGPRANVSGIDITQYFRAFIQPGQNLEEAINALYATGQFDLVEPEYIDKLYFTPNDPSISSQYYLNLIKAFDAWDITQGSDDVVIAIVDSGGNLTHSDLADKLYINPNENSTNSNDDDGNGFIDDWRGWDFVGADSLNVNNSSFLGDNDPSVPKGGPLNHGTAVAGCAAASTNNGIGIAGVGFNTKILFTKHSGDNQNAGGIYRGYSGILYAAELLYTNGKKAIINASWGGPTRSQIAQDVITYVTLERGALVIAAAGNGESSAPHYPSSYDHVLSVAATNQTDIKAGFSNFGKTVDISAPGVSIRTTSFDNAYTTLGGTSFSAPIVSGAAALVWAHNPTFTPTQVAEQLRVSADESLYTVNSGFTRMLGKGRLDIFRALTLELPSIRAQKPRLVNHQGTALQPGQPGKLFMTFTNFLKSSSSGTQVTITSLSGSVTITKGTVTLGIVPEGGVVSNSLNPFELTISSTAAQNTQAEILITYQDGLYNDFQFFTFIVNPSYIDIDDNLITTSIASKGRIGYDDPQNQGNGSGNGSGFVFNDASILYEMGLMMGTSSATLKNNVRGINANFDQDFFVRDKIQQIKPGERSFTEVFGSFSDASTEAASQVKINYRGMVWRDNPVNKFVIMEYTIKNVSASNLVNFRFGIFADWDISDHGGNDKAKVYNEERIKLGYVYPAQSTELPMAGIQLLNHPDKFGHYAIDNNHNIPEIPFGLYDGFTDAQKFTTLSTSRDESAASQVDGNDVSHTISAGPFDIAAGAEITVAFALHAAFNLDDLLASASYADTLYNLTLQAPRPVVPETFVCYGAPATLTASGVSDFKWYRDFTGGEPLSEDATFITTELYNDTILYVSNAENNYESVRTPAVIRVKANPTIATSGFTTICEGSSLLLSAAEADEYLWNTEATTQAIEVTEAGDYTVTVRDLSLECESLSETITITVIPSPVASFTAETSGVSHNPINFTDESTEAISWLWQFGDGASSSQQNPVYQYTKGGDYTVTLTVTSANGCQSSITKPIDIITSAEHEISSELLIYPNPLTHPVLTIEVKRVSFAHSQIEFFTLQGHRLYSAVVNSSNGELHHQINTTEIPPGIYLVRVRGANGEHIVRKIVKTN